MPFRARGRKRGVLAAHVMTSPDPIPAATLILMRPGTSAPELLMIERSVRMAFAPGALVFPGGRIDPDDRILGSGDVDAAKVAAVRETIEETGLAVALDPVPDEQLEAALRDALAQGAAFSELLTSLGLRPRLDALVPFARWRPNFKETRTFDTYFFVARAPQDSRLPTGDSTESVHAMWTTAQDVLDRADRGEAHIIFPTRRNLERVALFASFEEAAADARAHPVQAISPRIEHRGGEPWLCIPQGLGYPITAERLASVRRG